MKVTRMSSKNGPWRIIRHESAQDVLQNGPWSIINSCVVEVYLVGNEMSHDESDQDVLEEWPLKNYTPWKCPGCPPEWPLKNYKFTCCWSLHLFGNPDTVNNNVIAKQTLCAYDFLLFVNGEESFGAPWSWRANMDWAGKCRFLRCPKFFSYLIYSRGS